MLWLTKGINQKALAWIVWIIGITYYLYEYIQRISPSLIAGPLMQTFHIDAAQVGSLTASYYYVYAVMQVPVGILADNFGPKRPLLIASICLFLGGILFSTAPSLVFAYGGRMLVGLGSAFGYICVLRLIVNWFDKKQFALLCGLVNTMGMLGAFGGEIILGKILEMISWHHMLFYLSSLGIIISLLIFFFVESFPYQTAQHKNKLMPLSKQRMPFKQAALLILTNRQIWLTSLVISLVYIIYDTLGTLWGIPLLKHVYHITNTQAISITSLIFLGSVFGFPFFGWLSSKFAHHKIWLVMGCALVLVISLLIWTMPPNLIVMKVLFFLLGISAGVVTTATTITKESVVPQISGFALSFGNGIAVVFLASAQPIFGYLIDVFAHTQNTNIAQIPTSGFLEAYMMLPIVFTIALIFALCVSGKKTNQS